VVLAASTPVKELKSGAALMMWTPTDDAAWVARYQAATERLRTKESATKVGASAQEVASPGDATWEPGLVEAVPGDARLKVPGVGGSEPGLTATTQATVEAAEAETSVRDVGWADVKESREVVEAPPNAGKEAA
jgi:flavin-binding protein dodecin